MKYDFYEIFSQITCERSATGLFISLRAIFVLWEVTTSKEDYGWDKWHDLSCIEQSIFLMNCSSKFCLGWKHFILSAPLVIHFSSFCRFYLTVFLEILLFFCDSSYCKVTSALWFDLSNMHSKIDGKIPFIQIWLLVWSVGFCAPNLRYGFSDGRPVCVSLVLWIQKIEKYN